MADLWGAVIGRAPRALAPRVYRLVARLTWLILLLAPVITRADTLADVRARGALRWTADQEGGGPFVYPRDDAPDEVIGFEVELAALLARSLGVQPQFTQAAWSTLPEVLATHKADLVLNGYEWTPALAERFETSVPYYVFAVQLMTRHGAGPRSWSALADGKAWRVGVLLGSAAEREVRARAPAVEVVSYDGNTDAMRDVETGKLDATVQDTPIVAFYGPRFAALERIDAPVGRGSYVALFRRSDSALRDRFDQSVRGALASGELERIYRSYGIWDDAQKELTTWVNPAPPGVGAPKALGARVRGFEVVRRFALPLLQSAGLTVLLSLCSFPLALLLGLLVALGRLYGPRPLSCALGVYVEVIRGTPLLLQLYFLFFVLPEIGLVLSALPTAFLGLALNYSAYEAEIYRAGLLAVPASQTEAALALGMSKRQALRHVVLPQAMRIVLPPAVNDFIALFKDTSVCSAITLVELTKRYSVLALSTQATLELMAITATLYLIMSWPLAILARRLERRLAGAQA